MGKLISAGIAGPGYTSCTAHSYVHLTSNRVMLRFQVFAASWAVLLVLWVLVFIGIALR